MRTKFLTEQFKFKIPVELRKKINFLTSKAHVNLSAELRDKLELVVNKELHNLYHMGLCSLEELREIGE